MPVLLTIYTINTLFRRGSDEVSFLDPEALRTRCSEVIEDSETRKKAILMSEELHQHAQQYSAAVASGVEAYLAKTGQWDASANDLIEQLQSLDTTRLNTMQEIVRVRKAMRELLSEEQWQQIFE